MKTFEYHSREAGFISRLEALGRLLPAKGRYQDCEGHAMREYHGPRYPRVSESHRGRSYEQRLGEGFAMMEACGDAG